MPAVSRCAGVDSLGLPDPAAVEGTDVEKLAAFQGAVQDVRQRLSVFIPAVRKARRGRGSAFDTHHNAPVN